VREREREREREGDGEQKHMCVEQGFEKRGDERTKREMEKEKWRAQFAVHRLLLGEWGRRGGWVFTSGRRVWRQERAER